MFGASGKVGRLVVRELLREGWEVTAFVHRSSPFTETKRLRVAKGDIHSAEDVRHAIEGSQVVISALGSWGTKSKDIVSSGMENIIAAMSESGIKRVVSLTGADALVPGEYPGIASGALRPFIKISPARDILADGERHIRLLDESRLDWTVIRSPIMNGRGDPHEYSVGNTKPKPWATINRQSVAIAMAKAIDDRALYRKAPFIIRKHPS